MSVSRRRAMEQLSATFDEVSPLLQAGLDRGTGEYALDDIKYGVMMGDMQLWAGMNYAAVTEVINYPQRRVVLVHLAGGELDALFNADESFMRFVKMVGATGIEIIGRKGWSKVLRDRGFDEVAVRLFKEV